MNSQVRRCSQMLVVVLLLAISGLALAAGATKDEAVAMVKKAVAAINTEGAEKVYAEISDPKGPFVDRDLYIVVLRMDGLVRTAPTRSASAPISSTTRTSTARSS